MLKLKYLIPMLTMIAVIAAALVACGSDPTAEPTVPVATATALPAADGSPVGCDSRSRRADGDKCSAHEGGSADGKPHIGAGAD